MCHDDSDLLAILQGRDRLLSYNLEHNIAAVACSPSVAGSSIRSDEVGHGEEECHAHQGSRDRGDNDDCESDMLTGLILHSSHSSSPTPHPVFAFFQQSCFRGYLAKCERRHLMQEEEERARQADIAKRNAAATAIVSTATPNIPSLLCYYCFSHTSLCPPPPLIAIMLARVPRVCSMPHDHLLYSPNPNLGERLRSSAPAANTEIWTDAPAARGSHCNCECNRL